MAQASRVVLVVEDDAALRELATALLEETELTVVEAASAEAAFDYLTQHGGEVALVFTDVRLPGRLDGVDLARAVEILWPTARVVVTSGHACERVAKLPDTATFMAKPWRALDVLVQAEKAAAQSRAPFERRGRTA